jgi:uncharacterized protein (DUF433 family)
MVSGNMLIRGLAVTQKPYVRDDNGALRVGEADVSLDSLVIGFQDGLAPEAIQLLYPSLTLEEVYGAITYYLANRPTVDQYLSQQAKLWADLRRSADRSPSPVVTRLREVRHAAVGEPA